MKIDRNSYFEVALVWACCIGTAIVLIDLVKFPPVAWPCAALMLWTAIWQTYFFHVPNRKVAGDAKEVLSVCDGKVVIAEKVFERQYLKKDCYQVSVYMNFFDVHANFWPVSGEVLSHEHFQGQHLLAVDPKASDENEHTCTVVRTDNGTEILFRQIAGGYATRIVNYAKPGLEVSGGKQCGIIKFGSRIDLFFPLEAQVKVSVGDSVRACETVIARLS